MNRENSVDITEISVSDLNRYCLSVNMLEENRICYYPWQEGLYDPVLIVRDGKVQIPEDPGWGVTIRQDWLDRANHQISEMEN